MKGRKEPHFIFISGKIGFSNLPSKGICCIVEHILIGMYIFVVNEKGLNGDK